MVDYEVLRSWARARPRPRTAPGGVTLLLRQGLAHWLVLRASLPLTILPRPTTHAAFATTQGVASDQRRALIAILATMIAQAHQETPR